MHCSMFFRQRSPAVDGPPCFGKSCARSSLVSRRFSISRERFLRSMILSIESLGSKTPIPSRFMSCVASNNRVGHYDR